MSGWNSTAPRSRVSFAAAVRRNGAAGGRPRGTAAERLAAAAGADVGEEDADYVVPHAPPAAGEETTAHSPDGGDEVRAATARSRAAFCPHSRTAGGRSVVS
jgi:hypothetical protein